MIEAIVIDHLKALGVPVSAEMPVDYTPPLVVVVKTGGHEIENSGVYTSLLAVKCYGETLYKAACLADEALMLMHGLVEIESVTKVELNAGTYNNTDPETKRHCYQAVYEITHY